MFALPPPVENIQIEPETIAALVENRYGLLPPVQCEFVRRGFNDTYRITTEEDGTYILRVYFQGKYYIGETDDFQWELDLLDFLFANGVPVSHPQATTTGETLGRVDTAGGERCFALFTNAEGEPGREMTESRARNWGEAVAHFHTTANRFRSSLPRYEMNLTYLVEQPLALLTAYFARLGRQGELAPLIVQAGEWAAQVRAFAMQCQRDEYGIIHGDPHAGNVHFDDDLPTLFDFDHGGYGWRAWDLATSWGSRDAEQWRAFLDAYTRIRPMTQAERDILPVFKKIRPLWDIGDVLAMQPAWGKTFETMNEEEMKSVLAAPKIAVS